jgi:hypothetical protein
MKKYCSILTLLALLTGFSASATTLVQQTKTDNKDTKKTETKSDKKDVKKVPTKKTADKKAKAK